MGSDISTTNLSKSHGTLSHEKVHDALEVVIRKLGKEGFYFIHKGKEGPKTGKDSNNMWLWIKKSSKSKIKPTVIRIENFIRGTQSRSISPKKGQTLILATVARVPNIDQFQRIAGSSRVEFKGFFDRGYMVNEDFYYVNHPMHKCKKRRHEPEVITKWRYVSKAYLRDGDAGKFRDSLGGHELILEVFATGSAISSWTEETSHIAAKSSGCMSCSSNDGLMSLKTTMKKIETNFVDRVEYRLSLNGQVWAEWFVNGDGFPEETVTANSLDIISHTPLFTNVQVGGFVKSLEHRVTTVSSTVDPVLSLLVAHLCATEFNVQSIKAHIKINTPDELPFGNILTWGMPKSLSRELPSSLSHIVPEGDKENSSMGENLLSKSISRGNESFIR